MSAVALMRWVGRIFVLALLAAGILAAWRWRAEFDPQAIKAFVGNTAWAPVAFLAIHVAASLFFVPRTLLAIVAGLLFGAVQGVFWAAFGSVLGAATGFLAARYIDPDLVDRALMARFAGPLARVERGGWRMVAMLRLIPIVPHSLANYALGLTRLRLGPYMLGSLIGQLPLTIAYVNLGAAGGRALTGGMGWLVPSAIGAAVLGLSMLLPVLARRRPAA